MVPPRQNTPSSAKGRKKKKHPVLQGLPGRFAAFVAERFPFALRPAIAAIERTLQSAGGDPGRDVAASPRHVLSSSV